MPTYLGHLGQPGIGGPISGAFGNLSAGCTVPPTWQGVGVGLAPPPVPGIGRPLGTSSRVSST